MRNDVLKVTLVTFVLGLSNSIASAQSLRMQSAFPSGLTILGEAGTRFVEEVAQKTNNSVEIQYFEPNTLSPTLDTLDAVANGTVDLAFTTPGIFAENTPALSLFTAIPFGASGLSQYQWVRSGEGRELFDELHTRLGVKALPCLLIGPEGGGWFRQPIRQVSDFNNLNIRFFGLGSRVISNLGANISLLSGSDTLPALQTGQIDAAEFSTPAIDLNIGFDQVVKNYYYPAWHQRNSISVVYFNPTVWQNLSVRNQAIVEDVCHDNVLHWHTAGRELDVAALDTFRSRGITPRSFPRPVLTALAQQWRAVLAEEAGNDADFLKIWRSYRGFLNGRSESYRGRTTSRAAIRTHPDRNGFYSNRGTVTGRLRTIGRAGHMLWLQKQNPTTKRWRRVARASTGRRINTIRYNAAPGFYRWAVLTNGTPGRYSLNNGFN